LLSDPNANKVKEELRHLELLVVQDIFLSETAELAHVVLPGVSFVEKDGTFTNTERRVQRVRQAIEPLGKARPDWQIICDLSSRLGYPMKYGSPAEVMEEIASLTPSYGGIRYHRLEGLGLQWPCPTSDHPGTPFLHKDKFSRGKGKFHVVPYVPAPELPDEEYPFLLTTGRVLYHYHTLVTRKSKGLSEIYPEGVVEVNPEDARRLGIQPDNGLVEVASRRGKVKVKAKVSDRLPPGVVFMTFHFKEAAANLLTLDALDPVAKIPEFKVCAVKIQKV
jgi:predicted molibdopterin-dependent oxidoreductase YjgC